MIVKICRKHGELQEKDTYPVWRSDRKKNYRRCRLCHNERACARYKKFYNNDPIFYRQKQKEYRKNYSKNNPIKLREKYTSRHLELKNIYIRQRLKTRGLWHPFLPNEFIEFYRAYLMLKRLIKEKNDN
jgi:hypothetical protein